MAERDFWQDEPRDDRGRWTIGGTSVATASPVSALRDGVEAGLSGLPMAVLDCLGQTLAAMPRSKYLQASMAGAWEYCLDEDRGAARCARLKPTDPDYLPVPPFHTRP